MKRRWLPLLLAGGVAAHAAPAEDDAPVVQVSALRNPEVRSYRAIVAGMDVFDARHALAPAVPQLRFIVRARTGGALAGPVTVKLATDDWTVALALDTDGRFVVPRNEAAWEARAELRLDQRQYQASVAPDVRTPGLPDDRRRLGDLRLECRVQVAMAKEELGFLWSAALSGALMTTDWCAWFGAPKEKRHHGWWVPTGAPGQLVSAVLREGERSVALKVSGQGYSAPTGDTSWSDEAIVELAWAAPDAIRTAGETPRTAP
jgi:hypothetical protein